MPGTNKLESEELRNKDEFAEFCCKSVELKVLIAGLKSPTSEETNAKLCADERDVRLERS